MKVHFYATLRDITGQKTVDMDLPDDATVRQLVDAVVRRFPAMQKILLQESGDLYGHVHVFVNGRDTPFLPEKMETVIQPSDVINIFPAVGGG